MILVTGGTGFVGSHVVKTLVDNGHTPIIITRDSSSFARLADVLEKVCVFNLSEKPLEQIFEDFYVDTIIHLSTYYRKNDSEADESDLIEANLNFPLRLLSLGVDAGVKRFINTNTYFQLSPFPLPISPANEAIPFNLYAQTKMDFKQKLKSYCGKLCVVNIFLFTPYGPMDNPKLVDSVIRTSLAGGSLSLSEGLQKLDLIYVDDVASAYLAAYNSQKFDQQAENELVVASGFPVSVRDVVSVVEELIGKTVHKTWEKSVNNDYRLVYGDTTTARQLIDWEPKTSLHDGIEKTIRFLRSQLINSDD